MSKEVKSSKVANVQVFNNRCGVDPQQETCVNFDSKNLSANSNYSQDPYGYSYGLVAKLPVVLADLTVRFFVNATINLPEPVLEIRSIRKKLKITQCMLLQPSNVLFIKGFVRKSLDYTTSTCSDSQGFCGDIRHCTIDVPFEATTEVCFSKDPVDFNNSWKDEYRYLKKEGLPRESFAEKDKLLSSDLSEFNQESGEWYNELPYCDLIYSVITEFDEFINRRSPENIELPFEERLFSEIEEKMVIELRLNLLQKQLVEVPPTCFWGPTNDIQSEVEEEK